MTSETEPDEPELDRDAAADLADRICVSAAEQARTTCRLLELVGEFDAGHGWAHVAGMTSISHWLSWACSMSPGVAREHVRVARAMRRMPTVTAAFRRGELSYSKVREITRVVDVVDEAQICDLARYATASQLARMIAAFGTAAGTRIRQQDRRRLRLIQRDGDPMMNVSGVVAPEEGALIAAALNRARDLNAAASRRQQSVSTSTSAPDAAAPDAAAADPAAPVPDPAADPADAAGPSAAGGPPAVPDTIDPRRADATPGYTDVDAIRDICRHYLDTAVADDASGEDRDLVIIEVAAEQLLAVPAGRDVPAGTSEPLADPLSEARSGVGAAALGYASPADGGSDRPNEDTGAADTSPPAGDVPAGTPARPAVPTKPDADATDLRARICTVRGGGPIEAATAQRLVCTGTLLGAVVDVHGDVLALGRSRRLVSKAQRRALMVRDRICQFPGCRQDRHLQAHHVVAWSHGGATDLANLILLCRSHHIAVHEGGVRISRSDDGRYQAAQTGDTGWRFVLPDGSQVAATGWRVFSEDRLVRELAAVAETSPPQPTTIAAVGGGAGFQLQDCVRALFGMTRAVDAEAA